MEHAGAIGIPDKQCFKQPDRKRPLRSKLWSADDHLVDHLGDRIADLGRTSLRVRAVENCKIATRQQFQIGNDDSDDASRAQHSPTLAKKALSVLTRDVLEQVRVIDDVERSIGERNAAAEIPHDDRAGNLT